MIYRPSQNPDELRKAMDDALEGQPSVAVLAISREITSVSVARLVVRVKFERQRDALVVEVGMPARDGNPFRIDLQHLGSRQLLELVDRGLERIISG